MLVGLLHSYRGEDGGTMDIHGSIQLWLFQNLLPTELSPTHGRLPWFLYLDPESVARPEPAAGSAGALTLCPGCAALCPQGAAS